ncbi:MAG: hypothetical protein Q9191_001453 [Dirinaria sp. TL-2023a]
MSGARDDQWRPARGNPASQGQNRQSNQQQRRNQSREAGQGRSIADSTNARACESLILATGNAWQSNERGNKDGPLQGLPQENHMPVRGFNALEIRDALKHGPSLCPCCSSLVLTLGISIQQYGRRRRESDEV